MNSTALSREEHEELVRSKKKVKDVSHEGYQGRQDAVLKPPYIVQGGRSEANSFKEKLIGDIPGAYTQAFNFSDLMEDDEESDEEVENLREGLVAVKLSKDFKKKIRTPWTRALIVKVYGRGVSLSFLQSRLLSMWKPAGRLDCVDLEQGFFLTRFYLKKDYEATLQRGPGFIGEHFLSIRPWEPNFRSESANVTSVAVWIRLNGLPIKYYNSEALLQIGKSIGNVLRVDIHTANEAKGRFARLCVQIDMDKPLVTAVLIGRFEQSICYEGIQKLCFTCGRLGHRKENCPYTVHLASPAKERMTANERDGEGRTCDMHVPHGPAEGMENSRVVHGNVAEAVQESTYGPWTVVARRRNVPKNQRSGRAQAVLDNGQLKQEQRKAEDEAKFNLSAGRKNLNDGLRRESKRKLDPPKDLA